MKSVDIASKIAFIQCKHKSMGSHGCISCIKRLERYIDDTLGISTITAAAQFFEEKTKLDKITPLTWCQAYDITDIILKANRKAN